VLCPDCRGAGGERDECMVLISRCEGCQPSNSGYVKCPRCQGAGVARHRVTLPF
jgi:DnaJ-class molecular chaperone